MRFSGPAIALAIMAITNAAPPPATAAIATARSESAAPEADRRAILGMAGTYKVRFDFREKVAFVPGYAPIAPKSSGGREVVRIIEDSGNRIVLQHLLVAADPAKPDAPPTVIKHWRQDWVWQPTTMLTYRGDANWALAAIAPRDAAGAWSQTVWQTDDSPRYGAIGRWTHDKGVTSWTSEPTLRPLARRDAVRRPPYDRYLGINRHALTPTGWVHEQENAKLGTKDGRQVTFVDETVVNSYDRFNDFNVAAADAYWARTAGYWAGVRRAWDRALAPGRPLMVAEVAETGSATGERLMGWADAIAAGTLAEPAAASQAAALIAALDAPVEASTAQPAAKSAATPLAPRSPTAGASATGQRF